MILSGIAKESDVINTMNSINGELLNDVQMEATYSFINDSKKFDSFCTSCGYCLPCPARIDIPAIMQSIFLEKFNGDRKESIENYSKIDGYKGDGCIECGECEANCTQDLDIIRGMRYVDENY